MGLELSEVGTARGNEVGMAAGAALHRATGSH